MEMPWYSVRSFLFLFFCLEATLGQDTYESDFRHCYGNFFESSIPEVTISQLCWSLFSTIARHINNSILKNTLCLKILWTWIKIRAKTLVNIMKRKSTKVPLNIITREKNATQHYKEHYTKIDISLAVINFFFSQTKDVKELS